MILKQITLTNFGCFAEKKFSFDPALHLWMAQNEAGKTTLLDALRIGFYGTPGANKRSSLYDNPRLRYYDPHVSTRIEIEFTDEENTAWLLLRTVKESDKKDQVKVVRAATGEELKMPKAVSPGEYFMGVSASTFLRTLYVTAQGSLITAMVKGEDQLLERVLDTHEEKDLSVEQIRQRVEKTKEELGGKTARAQKLGAEKNAWEKAEAGWLEAQRRERENAEAQERLQVLEKQLQQAQRAWNKAQTQQQGWVLWRKRQQWESLQDVENHLAKQHKEESLEQKQSADKMMAHEEGLALSRMTPEDSDLSLSALEEQMREAEGVCAKLRQEKNELRAQLQKEEERQDQHQSRFVEKKAEMENLRWKQEQLKERIEQERERLRSFQEAEPAESAQEVMPVFSPWGILAILMAIFSFGFAIWQWMQKEQMALYISVGIGVLFLLLALFERSKQRRQQARWRAYQAQQQEKEQARKQRIHLYEEQMKRLEQWQEQAAHAAKESAQVEDLVASLDRTVQEQKQKVAQIKERIVALENEETSAHDRFMQVQDAFNAENLRLREEQVKQQERKEYLRQEKERLEAERVSLKRALEGVDVELVRRAEKPEEEEISTEQLRALQEQWQALQKESSILHAELKQGRTRSVAEWEQEMQDREAIYKRDLQQWNALVRFEEIIQKAYERMSEEVSPKLNVRAQELFSSMTGEDARFLIDRSFGIKLKRSDLREGAMLSSGTQQQIYLALRLAIIEMAGIPGPILLDDALVFYDDARAAQTYQFLQEYAKAQQRQILFFTCHGRFSA